MGGFLARATPWSRRVDADVCSSARRTATAQGSSLRVALATIAVALGAALGFAPAASAQGIDVLLFHGTEGAADPSTSAAIDAIEDLGDEGGFDVTTTSSAADINAENLENYRAVILLHSAGDVFNSAQENALQNYVQAGNGVLSIGRAAELETGSNFFNGLIGARPAASSSDAVTEQVVEVGDRVHPATRDLPLEWGPRADRWYEWQSNPTGQVHTVARVRFADWTDDAVRSGSTSRAISWCRDFQGGRSFYVGMGRTADSYAEANFQDHLLGAIQWTAGMVRGNCKATINSNYQATRLTQPNASGQLNQTGEPHGVVVAPNGWVIYIGRSACANNAVQQPNSWDNPNVGLGCGTIHIWDPEQPQAQNNRVTLAGQLDVFGNRGGGDERTKTEHGLLGITLAPDFMESEHIYVYWVPHETVNRTDHTALYKISRFRLDIETKTLIEDSEVPILQWRDQAHSCCHVGGGMGWDSEGNLYVTTGDSNSSEGTGGYSGNNPVPEFAGISYQDARRTAGNTNNLNGKLLRIKPITDLPDGADVTPGIGNTYTIPDGPNGPNLFTGEEGNGDQARPEIFAMGLRNPSRLFVDPVTDWVYTAWVGPDAGSPNVDQGPEKYESAAVITEAGNYGWPYCMGNKQPYRDRLDNGQLSNRTGPGYIAPGWYDCDNPRNDSVRNTGLTDLPPVTPVNIWYGPGSNTNGCGVYPVQGNGVPNYSANVRQNRCPWAHGGSQAIMNGPLYRVPDDADPSVAWPEYWEGRWFLGDESGNDNIRHALLMDPDTVADGGLPTYVDNLKAIIPMGGIGNLMDWKFGEDGSLYVLNYSGFFTIGSAASLWRITYVGGPDTPNPDPRFRATGAGEFEFSIGSSGGVSYEWDFGDGSPTSSEANPTHAYEEDGQYDVTLTVTYADGEEISKTVKVNVFVNDTTAPTSSHELDPASPNGPGGVYRGTVKVTLDAEDNPEGSGVDRIEYRINGGVWQTYDEPFNVTGNGDYTIQYRAIDLAGNQEEPNEVSFTIDNSAGGGETCLPQTDEFGGTSLDGKWDVLRSANGGPQLVDGEVKLPLLQGDFIANDPLASNVLLQDAPDGEWTAVTRLNLTEIDAPGEQAGIVVWKSESPNTFSKIVFIENSAGTRQFEHIVTKNGSVSPPIAQSITVAPPSLPEEGYVLLRARYDGNAVIGEFSADDGGTWTRIGQADHVGQLDQPLRVGLTAFRGSQGGGVVGFDWFRVFAGSDAETGVECGAGSCLPEADDFRGDQLDGKWQIFNDAPSLRSVANDHLTLTMAQGDVYMGNFTAQNILLQDVPNGPWTATAKIKHTTVSVNGRAAGLLIYGQNNPNYFAKAAIQYKTNDLSNNPMNGIWMERTLTTNGAVNGNFGGNWPNSGKLAPTSDYVWVRAVFDGESVSTFYSLDGATWTANAPAFPASALGANGVTKIGLFAKRDGEGGDAPVDIDYFHLTGTADANQPADCSTGGDTSAPTTTASVDPANPDGEQGWYASPVQVTLSAEDEGEGVETTEYRVDGGDWAEYTEPFAVGGDGVRTVQYRSIDAAGNTESPKSLELRIDESAPETSATLSPGTPDGPGGSYNGPVEVTLDADDGPGSGVARTEFRVDGGPWTPYLGYQTLLDDTPESFAKWRQAPSGSFQHRADGSILSQGGLGMLWYEPQEFADFSLKFQFRDERLDSGYSNGGAFVRFPNPEESVALPPAERPDCQVGSAQSSQAWVAIYCGHEIQIYDGPDGEPQKTGSIYNFQPVGLEQAKPTAKGQWNDYEIRVVGQTYTIIRNGEVINEYENSPGKSSSRAGDPPTDARQFAQGHIGLQNHGTSDVMAYRNVRVMPIVEGGVEGPVVVEGEGQHKVEFRSVDVAGHTEDVKTVMFRIGESGGPSGKAELSASVKPAKKRLGAKAKRVAFRFKVTNQGDAATPGDLQLCVKAQKKRFAVKGATCVKAKSLGAEMSVAQRFILKPKKAARGKRSRVRFVVNGPGVVKRTVVAQLQIKKPKRGGR